MVTAITAMQATCESCGFSWTLKGELPLRCPACRTRAWNRPKRHFRSHIDEIAFPAPRPQGRPKVMAGGGIYLDDAE